jgi:hypothetical protein
MTTSIELTDDDLGRPVLALSPLCPAEGMKR